MRRLCGLIVLFVAISALSPVRVYAQSDPNNGGFNTTQAQPTQTQAQTTPCTPPPADSNLSGWQSCFTFLTSSSAVCPYSAPQLDAPLAAIKSATSNVPQNAAYIAIGIFSLLYSFSVVLHFRRVGHTLSDFRDFVSWIVHVFSFFAISMLAINFAAGTGIFASNGGMAVDKVQQLATSVATGLFANPAGTGNYLPPNYQLSPTVQGLTTQGGCDIWRLHAITLAAVAVDTAKNLQKAGWNPLTTTTARITALFENGQEQVEAAIADFFIGAAFVVLMVLAVVQELNIIIGAPVGIVFLGLSGLEMWKNKGQQYWAFVYAAAVNAFAIICTALVINAIINAAMQATFKMSGVDSSNDGIILIAALFSFALAIVVPVIINAAAAGSLGISASAATLLGAGMLGATVGVIGAVAKGALSGKKGEDKNAGKIANGKDAKKSGSATEATAGGETSASAKKSKESLADGVAAPATGETRMPPRRDPSQTHAAFDARQDIDAEAQGTAAGQDAEAAATEHESVNGEASASASSSTAQDAAGVGEATSKRTARADSMATQRKQTRAATAAATAARAQAQQQLSAAPSPQSLAGAAAAFHQEAAALGKEASALEDAAAAADTSSSPRAPSRAKTMRANAAILRSAAAAARSAATVASTAATKSNIDPGYVSQALGRTGDAISNVARSTVTPSVDPVSAHNSLGASVAGLQETAMESGLGQDTIARVASNGPAIAQGAQAAAARVTPTSTFRFDGANPGVTSLPSSGRPAGDSTPSMSSPGHTDRLLGEIASIMRERLPEPAKPDRVRAIAAARAGWKELTRPGGGASQVLSVAQQLHQRPPTGQLPAHIGHLSDGSPTWSNR